MQNEEHLQDNLSVVVEENFDQKWKNAYANVVGNFNEAINEFLDNSISNLISSKFDDKRIDLKIYDIGDKYTIQIRDSGTGIKISNLGHVFGYGVGDRTKKDTTMNDHGCGMKHALASLNKENDNWFFITKACKEDTYIIVKHPYSEKLNCYRSNSLPEEIVDNDVEFKHGTLIQVNVDKLMLMSSMSKNTADKYSSEANDNNESMGDSFDGVCSDLIEDIKYVYGPILEQKKVSIYFYKKRNKDNGDNKPNIINSPLKVPNATLLESEIDKNKIHSYNGRKFVYAKWDKNDFIRLSDNADDSTIKIYFNYYKIDEVDRDHNSYRKHYLGNEKTSGVEIRFNGRLMVDNLFTSIFNVATHNSYNHMIIQIDVVTDDINKLPLTKVNKNNILEGDSKYEGLKSFIRGKFNKSLAMDNEYKENQLVKMLFENRQEMAEKAKKNNDEQYYYYSSENDVQKNLLQGSSGTKILCDLYEEYDDSIEIYEFKVKDLTEQDLYQLMMYIDLLMMNDSELLHGRKIKAKLIGKDKSDMVEDTIRYLRNIKRYNPNKVEIYQSNWDDEFGDEMIPLKEDKAFPETLLNGYERSK
ncbi:ATP-binding protein [Apilactobacillus sp. 1-1-2]|uniref:ATP-binding protein n=1 Tax=Apilactobacillus sp. 1-1-2 TaxID=3411035 RepID=UPI003B94D165